MPTLQSPEKMNADLWSDIGYAIAIQEDPDKETQIQVPKPRDWTESFSSTFIKMNYDTMTQTIVSITTTSNDTYKTLKFLESNPQLSS